MEVFFFIAAGLLMFFYLRNQSRAHKANLDDLQRANFRFDKRFEFSNSSLIVDNERREIALIDWHASIFPSSHKCAARMQEQPGNSPRLHIPFNEIAKVTIEKDSNSSKQIYRSMRVFKKLAYCKQFSAADAYADCSNCHYVLSIVVPKYSLAKQEQALSDLFRTGIDTALEYIEPT